MEHGITVKDVLKRIRFELMLTQTQFGEMIGVSKTEVHLYEKGIRKPRLSRVRKIIEVAQRNGMVIKPIDLILDDDEK